jgi:hypothetical protein
MLDSTKLNTKGMEAYTVAQEIPVHAAEHPTASSRT